MIRLYSVFVLLFALPLAAEYVPGRYLVELEQEPAVAAKSATAAARSALRSQQDRVRTAVADSGIRVRGSVENVANILVVEGAETDVAALASLPGVRRVRPVRVFHRLLDRAVILQHVTDAWQRLGGMENAGAGVKIGIIDTGIDAQHPGLQDPQMSAPDTFPRIGVNSDLANTNSKIIVARSYDDSALASTRDVEGHGTGVAMVAAGRTTYGSFGAITGIAPKAYLGNYKVFPDRDSGAPEDAILKALDDAVTDGMDIVNLSLGSYPAERPETDILVQAVERAAAAGMLVVVAAGNDGPDLGTIGSPATAPSAISVGNAYTDRIFAVAVQLAGARPYLAVPGSGPNGTQPIAGPVRDVSELDPSGLACSELPPDSLRGHVAFILRGTCLFEEKLTYAERAGATAAIVYTHADSPSAGGMEVGAARLPAVMISHSDGLDMREHLKAQPGATVTVNFVQSAVSVDAGRLSSGSSSGPSVDLALKPELVAVGTSVYTAAASTGGSARFQAVSGTSFSAPMVAGALAVLKAARPGLSSYHYRSLLVNGSASFPAGMNTPGRVMQTGAGILQLDNAVKSTVALYPQVLALGATASTAEVVRTLHVSNLGESADSFSISAHPVTGTDVPVLSQDTVELAPQTSQSVEVRFTPSAGGTGEAYGFVLIRNASGDVEARVPYWFSVPSRTASKLTIIDANPTARNQAGSRQEYLIRPTDAVGLPVAEDPVVTVAVGAGSVDLVRPSNLYPGFYDLVVRLAEVPGENVFLVETAGASRRISVVGQ